MNRSIRERDLWRCAALLVLGSIAQAGCPLIINLPGGQVNVITDFRNGDILAVEVPANHTIDLMAESDSGGG